MVLRTVASNADRKGQSVFLHFSKPKKEDLKPDALNLDLNKLMQNVGGEQFHYGSFQELYDTDPRIKEFISNFSSKGIELNTSEADSEPQADTGKDEVEKMAKRATNLSDL